VHGSSARKSRRWKPCRLHNPGAEKPGLDLAGKEC
jgi:hypothetical protein